MTATPFGNCGCEVGISVAIDGGTAAVGARYADETFPTAIYVFIKPSNRWANATETATLTTPEVGSGLGYSTVIHGDTIVSGTPYDSNVQGAAYGFSKPAAGWIDMTQTFRVEAVDGASREYLGVSLAFTPRALIVGSPGTYPGNPVVTAGATYLFGSEPE